MAENNERKKKNLPYGEGIIIIGILLFFVGGMTEQLTYTILGLLLGLTGAISLLTSTNKNSPIVDKKD
jgi:uncharacterized membrane protein HdeD (DUF308 family)